MAMEVKKREQMSEKCEYTQQCLPPDEIYRISEMEETDKWLRWMNNCSHK